MSKEIPLFSRAFRNGFAIVARRAESFCATSSEETGSINLLLSRFESGERVPTAEQVDKLAASFQENPHTAHALPREGSHSS